jgi:microcystin-dependent protein
VATGPTGPSGTTGIFGSNTLNFRLGQSGGAECTLGSIMLNVSTEYPTNYLPADGRLIDIQTNTALFSLIGINSGGNGTSNYALPDLRSAAPNHTQYLICVAGIFP